jgi:hypothetical protein
MIYVFDKGYLTVEEISGKFKKKKKKSTWVFFFWLRYWKIHVTQIILKKKRFVEGILQIRPYTLLFKNAGFTIRIGYTQ